MCYHAICITSNKKGSYECGDVGIFGDCVRGEDEEVEMGNCVRQNGSGEGLAVSITFRSYHWKCEKCDILYDIKRIKTP